MGQPPEAVSQSGAAGTYTVVLQQRSTLVRSPTVVEDVEVIGVITSPSGIYFERAVPYANWLASSADPLIAPEAGGADPVASLGHTLWCWSHRLQLGPRFHERGKLRFEHADKARSNQTVERIPIRGESVFEMGVGGAHGDSLTFALKEDIFSAKSEAGIPARIVFRTTSGSLVV